MRSKFVASVFIAEDLNSIPTMPDVLTNNNEVLRGRSGGIFERIFLKSKKIVFLAQHVGDTLNYHVVKCSLKI